MKTDCPLNKQLDDPSPPPLPRPHPIPPSHWKFCAFVAAYVCHLWSLLLLTFVTSCVCHFWWQSLQTFFGSHIWNSRFRHLTLLMSVAHGDCCFCCLSLPMRKSLLFVASVWFLFRALLFWHISQWNTRRVHLEKITFQPCNICFKASTLKTQNLLYNYEQNVVILIYSNSIWSEIFGQALWNCWRFSKFYLSTNKEGLAIWQWNGSISIRKWNGSPWRKGTVVSLMANY